jgi:hypothetical protein
MGIFPAYNTSASAHGTVSMAENSYLFIIPDIGGFTRFVNSTDNEHSQALTFELLECLIKAAGKEYKTRNVEGDAVFFARQGEMPSPTEFMEQVSAFYTAFHAQLKAYDKNRICDCNACKSAHGLTLKVVAHYGKAGEATIAGNPVLHGKDVILVHRLLKNNVPVKEYVLLSEKAFNTWSDGTRAAFSAVFPVSGTHETPEGLDPLFTLYVPLEAFKTEVPEVSPVAKLQLSSSPAKTEFVVNTSSGEVYRHLYDLNLRSVWNKGVKKLEFEASKIHRAGTKHVCFVEGGTIDFETAVTDANPGELVYAERSGKQPFVKSVGFVFRLIPDGEKTRVVLEAHPVPSFFGGIFSPVIKKAVQKSLNELRLYMEAAFGTDYAPVNPLKN